MEIHGTGPRDGTEAEGAPRREITCSDCGHIYIIAQGQQSAHCRACGNIEFLPLSRGPGSAGLGALTQEILSRRVLPRIEEKKADPLESFRATPDGAAVEALRMRYQVEWQLWAVLMRHFQDHVYHMAYVCQCASLHELDKAAARYREHRNVMALSHETRWQAEVAELMLSRIDSIAAMRMSSDHGAWWAQLPARFFLMKTEMKALGIGWVVLGIVLGVKLFSALAR